MLISSPPHRVRTLLFTAIFLLVALHIVMMAGGLPMPKEGTGLRVRFNLGGEGNIPAKYATLQLLIAAGLLLVLYLDARRERRGRAWHWLALAGVFTFLAIDEYFQVHERFSAPTHRILGPDNNLKFAWVLPYGALVAVFAVAFLRFWRDLPPEARRGVAVAGAVYVGGALGMEVIGSLVSTRVGEASLLYAIEVVIEETMELLGIALFITALATLLRDRIGRVTVQLDGPAPGFPVADRRRGERRVSG